MTDEIYPIFVKYEDPSEARVVFDAYFLDTDEDSLKKNYLEIARNCRDSGTLELRLIDAVTLHARNEFSKLQHVIN